MTKKIFLLLLASIFVSCRTRMITVDFSDLNKSAIVSIQKYYPEYEEKDLVLSSVSYSSHISLLSTDPLPQDADKYSEKAFEGIYVGYTIKTSIADCSSTTDKIIRARMIYVALNPDGTLIAGKDSISFNETIQNVKK